MENKNIKNKVISGLFWKLMERGGVQGIQFIVQIVLARVLLPSDYGLISLLTIFISVSNVFIQTGFGTSLIQKKEIDEVDYSSVFYLNLLASVVVYIVLFFAAPYISNFYNEPQLTSVLRVLSIILFFGAINSVQNAVVSRTMQFKRFFYSSLGGIIISGIIGIGMAYAGFGVWALVSQQLSNQLIITIILWFTLKWRPKLLFSFERVKELFSFGWKLLCSSLIDTLYNNIYGLIIGKIYTSEILGYYNRADQFPQVIISNINGAIQSVMLPAMSESQEDRGRVKDMVRRSIVTSSFIIFPMMIGLAVCAKTLVLVLLTEKWLPCVPFLQILCLSYSLWPIHTANLQAINALGRSDIYLKLEIIKKCVGIVALSISIPFGIFVMVASKPFLAVISSIINASPNKKLLNYSAKEQWKDILPSLSLSIIMAIVIYPISLLPINTIFKLVLQVLSGIVIYLGLAYIFKLECFKYILNTVSELRKR